MNTTDEKRRTALADAEKKVNETAEQRWQEPAWTCRLCGWKNFAIRSVCRNWKCRHRRDAQA
jgi:hypothetical protein